MRNTNNRHTSIRHILFHIKKQTFMKHFTPPYMASAALAAMFAAASPATAQRQLPLSAIKAVKPSVQATLLDSVIGPDYRKIYEYNEYGYITSVMEYHNGELDTQNSYRQDYVFGDNGQCTERTRYNVDDKGNRTTVQDKGLLEVKDGFTWEHYWNQEGDGKLYRDYSHAYDQWGNLCENIEYRTELYGEDEPVNYICDYEKHRYSGPVDKYTVEYAEHYNHAAIAEARTLYSLECSNNYDTQVRSIENIGKLSVTRFEKTEWSKENGKLYRRKYQIWSDMCHVSDTESQEFLKDYMEKEETYTLNSTCTRPLYRIAYDEYDGHYEPIESKYTYEWDGKGRLTKEICEDSNGLTTTYTYADGYARELSLEEAINCINYDADIYPEDEFLRFGHVASRHYARSGDDYEHQTFTWNADGQLTGGTWKEVGHETDSNGDGISKDYEENGTYRFAYNDAGHLAYCIDNAPYGTMKTEFVYNDAGIWIDTYENWGDEYGDYTQSMGRSWIMPHHWGKALRKSGKKPAITIGDMSEGHHNIHSDDGVWHTEGHYRVEGGVIQEGYYRQHLISTASIPRNPAYNYTDPMMPLENTDHDAMASCIEEWHYKWNLGARQWECEYAPNGAYRVYWKDGHIIIDIYDSAQILTSTTVCSFDDQGRLAKEEGNTTATSYTYLEDTDYLLESVHTDNAGERKTYYYFYSLHDYVQPTAIEIVGTDGKAGTAYDTMGRKTRTPARGIYIFNGRKVMR